MKKEKEKTSKNTAKTTDKNNDLPKRKRVAGASGKSRKTANKKVSLNVKVTKTGQRKTKAEKQNAVRLKNEQDVSPVYSPPRILSEKIESDKRLIMWSGVTFFMLLIGFLWIFQVKQSIKRVELESAPDESFIELRMAAKNISDAIAEMKTDIAAVNDFVETEAETESEPELKDEESTDMIEVASSTEELEVVLPLPFPEAEDVGTSSVGDIDVSGLKEKLEEGLAE